MDGRTLAVRVLAGLAAAMGAYFVSGRARTKKLSRYRVEALRAAFAAMQSRGGDARWSSLQTLMDKASADQLPLEDFATWVASIDPTPYPNGLRFCLSPSGLQSLAGEIVARVDAVVRRVAAIPLPEATFENTLLQLSIIRSRLEALSSSIRVLRHVATDRATRAASAEAEEALGKFEVAVAMHRSLFRLASKVNDDSKAVAALGPEDRRLLQHALRDMKRNGLHLDARAARTRIKEIQLRMTELSTAYMRNLNEDDTKLLFADNELAGLADDYKRRVKRDSETEKYVLTLSYPDYFTLMKFCRVPETRRRMATAFNSRCMAANTPLIEEMIALRHEKARILGFQSHAHFQLEVNMAKSPEVARKLLTDVARRVAPLAENELAEMLQLKREQEGPGATRIEDWDYRFYSNLREEREYKIDTKALKPYFPLATVERGMLEIYQELLGLRFEQIKGEAAHVWHPDVRVFAVYDAGEGGPFVGHFYLDLHPRPGKYGHACVVPLQSGTGLVDNADEKYPRQTPAATMLANFTKPTQHEASLLTHDEVRTFFHEFGHVVHHICARTKLLELSGMNVERDFVEAPSQMLENWCWVREGLLRMCAPNADGKAIPDSLVEKLIKSRLANVGIFTKRQLLFGLFDLKIHSSDAKVDTANAWRIMQKQIMGIDMIPGTNPAASFGHLMGGYDAQYYTYMWDEVFSADMFESKFRKAGLMDRATGKEYRTKLIGRGGTVDASELLREFLGRKPSIDAFLQQKGLKSM